MFAKLKSWAILFNYENGGFSHTKWWSNIGYLTATSVVIHMAIANDLSAEMFGIYLSCTALHTVASKYLGTIKPSEAQQAP